MSGFWRGARLGAVLANCIVAFPAALYLLSTGHETVGALLVIAGVVAFVMLPRVWEEATHAE